MKRARLYQAIVAIALVGGATAASAQPATGVGELIARLKRQGDEAFAGGRYRDALQKYDESLSISPDPSLHHSRGRTLERLGRIADAVRAYELFITEASPELTARYTELPSHVASIKPRTALLRITAQPNGATVMLGETALGTTPIERPIRLDPGRVEIVVTRDGYSRESRAVLLTAGEESRVSMSLTPIAVAERPVVATSTAPAPEGKPITSRWWFWTGVAVVSAAAATTVVILTREPPESKGDIAPGRISAPLLRF